MQSIQGNMVSLFPPPPLSLPLSLSLYIYIYNCTDLVTHLSLTSALGGRHIIAICPGIPFT